MRLLFTMDTGDYKPGGAVFARPSVRGIILRGDGRLALVHARTSDYYKFPGGGIEPGENHSAALCREVEEEVGLRVLPDSIQPYGMVRRVEKSHPPEDIFLQENFYYFCRVREGVFSQHLDLREAQEGFVLCWPDPREAMETNFAYQPPDGHWKARRMALREGKVLQLLLKEGWLKSTQI